MNEDDLGPRILDKDGCVKRLSRAQARARAVRLAATKPEIMANRWYEKPREKLRVYEWPDFPHDDDCIIQLPMPAR